MKKEYLILLYIGGAIVLLFVVKSLLKKGTDVVNNTLGVNPELQRKNENKKSELGNLFSLDYYNNYMKKYGSRWNKEWSKEAEMITHKIWSSKGILMDDDAQAIAFARLFRNKGQVALVNRYFREIYKKDLLTYLNFLSKESMKDFLDIVSNLKEI